MVATEAGLDDLREILVRGAAGPRIAEIGSHAARFDLMRPKTWRRNDLCSGVCLYDKNRHVRGRGKAARAPGYF